MSDKRKARKALKAARTLEKLFGENHIIVINANIEQSMDLNNILLIDGGFINCSKLKNCTAINKTNENPVKKSISIKIY